METKVCSVRGGKRPGAGRKAGVTLAESRDRKYDPKRIAWCKARAKRRNAELVAKRRAAKGQTDESILADSFLKFLEGTARYVGYVNGRIQHAHGVLGRCSPSHKLVSVKFKNCWFFCLLVAPLVFEYDPNTHTKCTKCNCIKELTLFHCDSNKLNGRASWCLECDAEKRKTEHYINRRVEYKKLNVIRLREESRMRRLNNLDKDNARKKKQVATLCDSYVASKLEMPVKEIPHELFALKREQILTNRVIKQLKLVIKENQK